MKARLPKQNMGGAQNMNAMIRQAQKMQDEITTLQEENFLQPLAAVQFLLL